MIRLVAALLLAAAAVLGWYSSRDPLAALEPADPAPRSFAQREEARDDRRYIFATLATERLGPVSLVVSLPASLPPGRRLPVVVVLGGLGTGERNIQFLAGAGPNAIVGYDWPVPTRMPEGLELLRRAPELRARALSIPGQISTALLWLAAQPWADGERVSLLGFSLGALAAPATQRVAGAAGKAPRWTVLAYGGAPLGEVAASNPFVRPDWVRPLLRVATDLLLRPGEPSRHLPHLSGNFLVLEGREDAFVPAEAAARFRDLVPPPKRVISFEGGHMGVGPGQRELLERIVRTSREWLLEQRAVDPP